MQILGVDPEWHDIERRYVTSGRPLTVLDNDQRRPVCLINMVVRDKLGIPFAISSCHTGVVDGYAIEGHVPPEDVKRLLREKPKAIGLTVPGMPFGSPGMEQAGAPPEDFDTLLLLDRSGRTQVFARHKAAPVKG